MRDENIPPDGGTVDSMRPLTQDIYLELPTMIRCSEEKLKNWLQKYKKQLESKQSWKTPLATLIPLIFTLLTSTFKDVFGFKAGQVKIFCFAAICVVIIWLIKSGWTSYKSKSLDEMINELKGDLHRVSELVPSEDLR